MIFTPVFFVVTRSFSGFQRYRKVMGRRAARPALPPRSAEGAVA
jgi:hypothetical protein